MTHLQLRRPLFANASERTLDKNNEVQCSVSMSEDGSQLALSLAITPDLPLPDLKRLLDLMSEVASAYGSAAVHLRNAWNPNEPACISSAAMLMKAQAALHQAKDLSLLVPEILEGHISGKDLGFPEFDQESRWDIR